MERPIKGSWLRACVEYFRLVLPEVYDPFRFWVAVWVLSSALQRRVWMVCEDDKLYPNLFIWLIAPSAWGKSRVARKGYFDFIKTLPNGDRPATIRGKFSAQGLGRRLKEMEKRTEGAMKKAEGKGVVYEGKDDLQRSFICIFGDEAGQVFRPKHAPEYLIDFLNDLWDCPPETDEATKDRDIILKNTGATMLATVVPSVMSAIISKGILQGGFGPRNIYITQKRWGGRPNPNGKVPDRAKKMKADLQETLSIIAQISRGEHPKTPAYTSEWTPYYNKEIARIAKATGGNKGYPRMGELVRKMSLLYNLSRGDGIPLERKDMSFAIAVMEEARPMITGALERLSASSVEKEINHIRDILLDAPNQELGRSELLRKAAAYNIRSTEMQKALDMLMKEDGYGKGEIECRKAGRTNNARIYTYVGDTQQKEQEEGGEKNPAYMQGE